MATVQLNATKFGYIDEANPNQHFSVSAGSWYRVKETNSLHERKRFLLEFESFPSNLKRYDLEAFQIVARARGVSGAYEYTILKWVAAGQPFNENSVTWNSYDYEGDNYRGDYSQSEYVKPGTAAQDYVVPSQVVSSYKRKPRAAQRIAQGYSVCGVSSSSSSYNGELDITPMLSNNAVPYAIITYDPNVIATSKIEYVSGPKSGYYDPRNAAAFEWRFVLANISLTPADDTFTQASATFYWKKSTDENYTAVSVSGSTPSVTIPANTFPTASTIQWYVSGTDEDGTTTQTEAYSFSTAAETMYATTISPVSSVEDGSVPITFRWSLTSADGQPASRVQVLWKLPSEDNNSWHTLLDVNEAATNCNAPANTFPAGEIQWTVRAYNVDSVAGPWNSTKTFICVAAPASPDGLSATAAPLTTVTWQSGEQQAYEVSIDGVVMEKAFGADVYSWDAKQPLADGEHLISVRVQGQYSLWSQPSSVTVMIENDPPAVMTLTADFRADAELVLETETQLATTVELHWYRDGKQIAYTAE